MGITFSLLNDVTEIKCFLVLLTSFLHQEAEQESILDILINKQMTYQGKLKSGAKRLLYIASIKWEVMKT